MNINSVCDVDDNLNWEHEPDPDNWNGVCWNENHPKKVNCLWLEGSGLQGNLYLSGLTELHTVKCGMNHISQVDLFGLDNLVDLDLSDNDLTSININHLPLLEDFYVYNNDLDSVDLSGMVNLKRVYLDYNKVQQIRFECDTNLEELNLSGNLLRQLDVSSLKGLKLLYDDAGQLESIILGNLPDLWRLSLSENKLKTLDISGLPNLVDLFIYSNDLTDLDISQNDQLNWIECYNNRFLFDDLVPVMEIPMREYGPQKDIFDPDTLFSDRLLDYSSLEYVEGVRSEYYWYKNGFEVSQNRYSDTMTTTGIGVYYCEIYNAYEQFSLITSPVTIMWPLSTDLAETNETYFYPNPARDFIRLVNSASFGSAEIFNAIGSRVGKITDFSREYDISYLKPGIYFLKLNCGYHKSVQTQLIKY